MVKKKRRFKLCSVVILVSNRWTCASLRECVYVLQQENNPSSIMHSQPVNIIPSVHHSPPNQLPLASAPIQEDLWHLPGRLRESYSAFHLHIISSRLCFWTMWYVYIQGINPSLWDKEDVAHWLHWAQREYSLRRPEKGRFEMNGRALCLLTKEDFRRRCPSSGRNACECRKRACDWFCACVFIFALPAFL